MVCRTIILLTFAYSAGGKALDMRSFQEAVADFRVAPARWSRKAAWFVLAAEVAIVILMAVGSMWSLTAGFLLAAGLLLALTGVLIVALRRRARIRCNCFGSTERRISRYDAARNLVLGACGLVGLWSLSNYSHTVPIAGIALACLMAASVAAIVVNLRDVVETLRSPFRVL